MGPGLRGVRGRPTDFGDLRRVTYHPGDGSLRCSDSEQLAGSAKVLLECANWAAAALGIGPASVRPPPPPPWLPPLPFKNQ